MAIIYDPRTVVNLYERHKIHIDPNRPPMTKSEVVELSQMIGGIKRSTRTIKNATIIISKYEDRSDKKSDSGTMINAGIERLGDATFILEQAIDILESAREFAKEGK